MEEISIEFVPGLSFDHFLSNQSGEAPRTTAQGQTVPRVTIAPAGGSAANLAAMMGAGQSATPGAPPLLTRRQAIGLHRQMSQSNLSRQAGLAGPPSTGMMPQMPFVYGMPQSAAAAAAAAAAGGMWNSYMNMPGVAEMQQQQQQMMPPRRQSLTARPSPPPGPTMKLPEGATAVPLSLKTTEDVCAVLRQAAPGLSADRADAYCAAVAAQNLSGAVLSACELGEELKSVMGMTFGDWEVFKSVVTALREDERKRGKDGSPVNFSISPDRDDLVPSSPSVQPPQPSSTTTTSSSSAHPPPPPTSSSSSTGDARDSSATTTTTSSSSPPVRLRPPLQRSISIRSPIERQVTMEDAMISGLLSTLNEEAHEDILTEEMLAVQEEDAEDGEEEDTDDTATNTATASSSKDSPFVFISRKPSVHSSSSVPSATSSVVLHAPPPQADRLSIAEAGGEVGGGGATAATSWESCLSNSNSGLDDSSGNAGAAITIPAQVHASPKTATKEEGGGGGRLKRTKERHLRDR